MEQGLEIEIRGSRVSHYKSRFEILGAERHGIRERELIGPFGSVNHAV